MVTSLVDVDQRGNSAWKRSLNFFALRPTFTFFGLKIVWYVYLANTLLQAYVAFTFGISRLLSAEQIGWETWLPNSLPLVLGIVAQLMIVRLLLEVAAIIISRCTEIRVCRIETMVNDECLARAGGSQNEIAEGDRQY